MGSICNWYQGLGIAFGSVIFFSLNSAIAQITITPDDTLSNNSQVTQQSNLIIIEGGTRSGNNLFHSFNEFNIPAGVTVELRNASDIQNIIGRVTGKSISHIDGILKSNYTANLFLLNPNGIIFGNNATLQIGGSFIASTASSLNFADGTKFSATNPEITPLLTISVPVGLQFGVATPGSILNQSQANPDNARNPVGLQVQSNKTLALIGGDIKLESGNLTANSGRIELGSVAANNLVSITPNFQGWVFGYKGVQNFKDIQLIKRTDIIKGSEIPSQVDASNKTNANNEDEGGGNIQVQGNTVELIGFPVRLRTQTTGTKDGGDLLINAKKLILRDGAAISTATRGAGNGGKLTVNASDSVEIISNFFDLNGTHPSQLYSSTDGIGKAGDIIINTLKLRLEDRGQVAVDSIPQKSKDSQLLSSKGAGGNLIVNASDSVELIGPSGTSGTSQIASTSLSASTYTGGDPGEITITTGKLIVQGMSEITVNNDPQRDPSQLSSAGAINISAKEIFLDNEGKLTSNSKSGNGGNINLQTDLLLLRRGASISTTAGTAQAGGNGGNIAINAPNGFILAVPSEDSDIIANAFTGSGGRVDIQANGIYGIQFRESPTFLSDITASSELGRQGTVELNTPDVNPNSGLVQLPTIPVDTQVAQGCYSPDYAQNRFVIAGRGGLPPNPQDILTPDAPQIDWVSVKPTYNNRSIPPVTTNPTTSTPKRIVEATGATLNAKGQIVLSANSSAAPYTFRHNPIQCHGS
ncbi:MAG: filamentous hemagglutinin N-terminal domain-containing protein [Nostoc sp.]|uniref:two-partner secretion domain-containing protein n=1 Tax=Nostoc sp. TaxID=1180 RepID=UPI002FF89A79